MLGVRLGALLTLASLCAAQNSTSASSSPVTTDPTITSAATLSTVTSTINQTVTLTLIRNGSAEHCMLLREQWANASSNYEGTTTWFETSTSIVTYTSTLWRNVSYECTMTCPELWSANTNLCYAGPTTVYNSTELITSTNIVTHTMTDEYPSPTPDCTIDPSVCMSLSDDWSSSSSAAFTMTGTEPRPDVPDRPKCTECSSRSCTFKHAAVDLYFWPVTTSVSRDYCAAGPETDFIPSSIWTPDVNHTFVPTTTGAYTVVNGVTMYQGNVYLSIVDPAVYDNCQQTVTRARPGNNIITIASTDLYSIRAYPHNLYPYEVNYADFNEPVPFSAWRGQSYCFANMVACTVVFPGDYRPHMLMPPQIRTLDSNWADCEYDKYGLFDPPIALNSIGNMFSSTPTPPSTPEPVTTPPTPGQSGPDVPGPTVTPPPPASDPPVDPPASDPPTDPPASDPPVDPPASTPPVDPPASNPPTNDPPASNPPTDDPPVSNPPTNDPPASNPPVNDPPASNPPTNNPPASQPPNNNDPATNQPGPTLGQNSPQNPNPAPTNPPSNDPASPPVVTIGDDTLTVDPTGGGLVLNPSSTLTPGAPAVTVGDQTISVGTTGGIVIIGPSGTSTVVPTTPAVGPTAPTTQEITVVEGEQTLTIINNSNLVVGPGTTIGPQDPAVTVDGTTFSVGTSGIVVESSGGATTVTPAPTSTSSGEPEEFTGAAVKVHGRMAWSVGGILGAMIIFW